MALASPEWSIVAWVPAYNENREFELCVALVVEQGVQIADARMQDVRIV